MNKRAPLIALGIVLMAAGAAVASHTDETDVQAPRAAFQLLGYRGEPDEVQAPRGESHEVQAPRGEPDEVQAPRAVTIAPPPA